MNLINKKKITHNDVDEIKEIIVETSSLDHTKLLIGNLIGQSKSMLNKAKFREEGKQDLLELMDKILKRNK